MITLRRKLLAFVWALLLWRPVMRSLRHKRHGWRLAVDVETPRLPALQHRCKCVVVPTQFKMRQIAPEDDPFLNLLGLPNSRVFAARAIYPNLTRKPAPEAITLCHDHPLQPPAGVQPQLN